ncbi:MAG TPA: hypothetical protein VNO32_35015, partial [Candidatus Acidoferrum sp.]|nr:hypothetical protein [Candidatus Acidoferrum sp.]
MRAFLRKQVHTCNDRRIVNNVSVIRLTRALVFTFAIFAILFSPSNSRVAAQAPQVKSEGAQ